jgi:hypothetical protein
MNDHFPRTNEKTNFVATFADEARNGELRSAVDSGTTLNRLAFFRSASRCNASLGRLVEAHYDAQSILSEAHVPPMPDKVLAVWASTGRSKVVVGQASNGFVMNGEQKFCGGAHVIDSALLVVQVPEGEQLLRVDLSNSGVSVDLGSWKLDAFRDAGIATVSFKQVSVHRDHLIGPVNFYGNRPGFWLGAIRVAAGWAGLVDRLIDQLPETQSAEPYDRVEDGKIAAWRWTIDATLGEAARIIDGPESFDDKCLALCVRQVVVDAAMQILMTLESRRGPSALAFDSDWNTSCTELRLALGQHHGSRDLRELGEAAQATFKIDVS